jgi:membrane protease YdiL (CAAX protease family)
VVNSFYAMLLRLKAAWNWLPVIVRAIILGFALLTIGSTVTFLPLLGNLKFHPEIPWAFPMTAVVLAIYGGYFSGWGPPASTRDARKRLARASFPSARIWRAAIPAMLLGIIALVALRLVLPSLMPVPAPSVSIPLSSYPLPTIIGALLSIATIAGVTEEIAFRGYMQKPLEEAYENKNDWTNFGAWLFRSGSVFCRRPADGHLEAERGQIQARCRDTEE